ncbi:hypothetical protein ILUMI_10752 [Ignelater luminosus]|uniref:Uncharacterized protein n=1 Tax=Ignelater luminosus TaxID=2038154 RepID=A0A8K0GDC0_IGNLU|nr:hypothetical protein ILUMI_10752 [Ignelater luminosus]
MSDTSDSEYSGSDAELQEAFSHGLLKPGLNKAEEAPKRFVNNISGLRQKLQEFKLDLPWIEILDCVNKQAPLAPELAAQMLEQEQKRENQLKNNKKLPQVSPSEDPVLNDFKREMMFYRQAQASVLDAIPKIKSMGISTKRPEDYFAEMAKSDEHMQRIRETLMKKQLQQQRSEKVKQLRAQRKEGKALQMQTKLQRQQEKKQMLDQIKKVRKGVAKDLDFLDNKPGKNSKNPSKKTQEKRKWRDQKYGFGGKKRGSKQNTKDSAADISEYKRPPTKGKMKKGNSKMQRPGKNRRIKIKNRGRK